MKYKHIIWDYNGTILDDIELCLTLLNEMLATQDKPPHDINSYREVFGFPIRDYYIRAGFDFDITSFEELADYYMPTYGSRVRECKPREDIERVLVEAKELGIEQSILSAAKSPDITKQLTDLGLLDYFSFITGLDDNYANSKVHLAAKHIKMIDCSIDEILFIGDTDHDAVVAKEIGCDCVLLTMGHQSVETLQCTKCTVVESIDVLLNIISN